MFFQPGFYDSKPTKQSHISETYLRFREDLKKCHKKLCFTKVDRVQDLMEFQYLKFIDQAQLQC